MRPRTPTYRSFPALLLLLLLAAGPALAAGPDLAKRFKDKDACFLLYELVGKKDKKTKKLVTRFNEQRCSERFLACSTFKVPLAAMAFDRGVLKDESTSFKWDGKKREIEDWNRDHTAATWMKHSVVWYSQELTPLLGAETVSDYLRKFDYGNRDLSGGLTTAWLSSAENPTLKISPEEQIRFLERLWTDDLPISRRAMELTRAITYLETSPRGAVLHGKTGSSVPAETLMGWFVGHLSIEGREYVFALNFSGPPPRTGPKYAGMAAKELTRAILAEMKLF